MIVSALYTKVNILICTCEWPYFKMFASQPYSFRCSGIAWHLRHVFPYYKYESIKESWLDLLDGNWKIPVIFMFVRVTTTKIASQPVLFCLHSLNQTVRKRTWQWLYILRCSHVSVVRSLFSKHNLKYGGAVTVFLCCKIEYWISSFADHYTVTIIILWYNGWFG